MIIIISRALIHEHGWEVPLRCPDCGHEGMPRYGGWSSSNAIGFGTTPTIFANLACVACGRDLKSAAGEKVRELFAGVAIPRRNLWNVVIYVGGMVAALIILTAGALAGWWS